jgi:hypothetical protein
MKEFSHVQFVLYLEIEKCPNFVPLILVLRRVKRMDRKLQLLLLQYSSAISHDSWLKITDVSGTTLVLIRI